MDSYILDPRSRALPFCACLCLAHSSQRAWGRKWDFSIDQKKSGLWGQDWGLLSHRLRGACALPALSVNRQVKAEMISQSEAKENRDILDLCPCLVPASKLRYEFWLAVCALWLPLMCYLIPWWLPVIINFPGWLLSLKEIHWKKKKKPRYPEIRFITTNK